MRQSGGKRQESQGFSTSRRFAPFSMAILPMPGRNEGGWSKSVNAV
jgi:hypothetical protein